MTLNKYQKLRIISTTVMVLTGASGGYLLYEDISREQQKEIYYPLRQEVTELWSSLDATKDTLRWKGCYIQEVVYSKDLRKKHDAQSIVNLLCERDAIEERKDSLEQKIAVIKASDAYSKEGTSKELYSFGGALLSAISLFTAFLKGIIYYVNKDD
jgi:hypothetical protein